MSTVGQSSEHQLQDLASIENSGPDAGMTTSVSSLPPVDGGLAAWLFLLGSFFIEMFLWGELASAVHL